MRRGVWISLCLGVWAAACDDAGGGSTAPDAARTLDARVADAAPDADVPDAARDAEVVDATPPPPDAGRPPSPLRINELMPDNSGAWVDDVGEADDWVELINTGDDDLSLAGWSLSDRETVRHPLPDFLLAPGDVIVLYPDGTPEQGPLHLSFKLPSGGGTLYLQAPDGSLADAFHYPEAALDDSFQRLPDATGAPVRCRWATPARHNGDACGPPPPTDVPDDVSFAPFQWPDPWPAPPSPLALTELALRPASFVEVANVGDAPVDLSQYQVRVAAFAPDAPPPGADGGTLLAWPRAGELEPGERVVLPVTDADVAPIAANPEYEGAVTLWQDGQAAPVDRVDFMMWPEGASLARLPDPGGPPVFCATATPGRSNEACDPVPSREVHDRLHAIRTPEDFAALARGGTALGEEPVKFIVDMDAGDTVDFLSNDWDLHYTFIRERIDHQPHLDRCDANEASLFLAGWRQFSDEQYFRVEGRRYLLGTVIHHTGADLYTIEFAVGDLIDGPLMKRAFFDVVARLPQPTRWVIRPQESHQIQQLRTIEGQVPAVGPNAPFRGVTFQPLTQGTAYGVLTFVPAQALDSTALGPQLVVVTDQVPNDIDLVGGLITEAFQTPLAHVNLLSRNRGTPNMGLVHARTDPRLAPYFGQLVKLVVDGGGFTVAPADPDEAQRFWDSRKPMGPVFEPRLDTSVRGPVPLEGRGIEDLPLVGSKAAQLAELYKVRSTRRGCEGPLVVPVKAFAIPLVHSIEHFHASGAADILAQLRQDPAFRTDPRARAAGLARVRAAIMAHPVDPQLLQQVTAAIQERYGSTRLRFRSSSNTEDLPGFNGAGLYVSTSGALGDPDRPVDDAIRTVWAGLWRQRAYDERDYANIDQDGVAIGVLVHPAELSEHANGVGISRDVVDPTIRDFYLNVQEGEASVTNPAPGVTTDQLLVGPYSGDGVQYLARSSLNGGAPVMSDAEARQVACELGAIHDHWRELLDPDHHNGYFAVDIEFKLVGDDRHVLVKQARPYIFGDVQVPADCREL